MFNLKKLTNMKTYNKAELQIVRMNNIDIVTASNVGIGTGYNTGTHTGNAPQRRSIWD